MYWLFAKYGIMPHQYHDLPAGEKVMIQAFVNRYFEEAHH